MARRVDPTGIERAYLIDSLLALGAVHVGDLDLFQRVHASVVLADGLVDRPEPTFRHELCKTYKANREELDQDLAVQFPWMREATELLGAAASLPFTLRTILVNDKEEVTRRGYYVATGYDAVGSVPNWTPPRGVHALPSQVPVAAVLGGFRRERRREARARARKAAARLGGRGALDEAAVGDLRRRTERDGARWGEFADGLRDVFDGALGPFLLYREERAQHRAATLDSDLLGTEGGKLPSEVYGAEFLLRLFVRLPLLLERSPVLESALLRQDRRELIGFAEGIAALIVFLQKNVAACFRAMYREPLEGEWTPEEAELTRRCAVAAGAEDGQGEDGDGGNKD